MPKDGCLNSIHVPSHPQPSLKICISPPARFLGLSLLSIWDVSHLNSGPDICVSPPSWWRLTSNQVHKMASQFHPNQIHKTASEIHPANISNSYRFQDVRLNSTQTLLNLNQDFNILVSPLTMYHLTFIQVQCRGAKSSVDDLCP